MKFVYFFWQGHGDDYHNASPKRGLECLVRAPVFYGSLREQTGENGFYEYLEELVMFLQKSANISGNLRESTAKCNLGILYSSSL